MNEGEEAMEQEIPRKKEKDVIYKIPYGMDELESLIDSALDDMDFGGLVKSSFADLDAALKIQQREYQMRTSGLDTGNFLFEVEGNIPYSNFRCFLGEF